MGCFSQLAAAAPAQVALNNSIREIEVAPQTGPLDPHRAFIIRTTLQATESGEIMEFEVALKMRNFAELQLRLAHGERIFPEEVASKYNPTAADYAKVCDWLSGQGFEITHQDKTRLVVFARGKVSQIAKAMQTTFARVTSEGLEYTAAVTAPQVPSTLAPLLVGINGLQPFIRLHTPPLAKPNDLTSTNPPYVPSQIAKAYLANGLYSSNITGSGQTIAILMDDLPKTTDLTSFWQACGINQSLNDVTFIHVVSGNLNGNDQTEATLDTEWSSSLAPGANVRVYVFPTLSSTDINAALLQVYNDTTTYPIHQVSMSFGGGEAYQTKSQLTTVDQSIALLASAGVTLFASSGDGGSTPSNAGAESGTSLNVEWPASNPNVTGVGGTSLILNSDGSVNSEVVWNRNVVGMYTSNGGTGGGISTFYSRPSWQTGTGVPTGTMRCVPDVASAADPAAGAYIWLNGSASSIGGTSWSSPSWAGFCALINQCRANAGHASMGLLGPYTYQLAGTANFRDITSGNNATSNSGGLYSATTGYDLCTGIGVPNVQTLAQTLATYSSSTQQAPAFTSGQPPTSVMINTAYSFTLTASGNPTPTFSLTSGSLPSGLSLSSAGLLSGTPMQAGPYTGTITASNGVSPNATQNFSISVQQAPSITSGAPPTSASVNTAYSFTFTSSGFPVPTFSITLGAMPLGLTLSSAGVISGAPTTAGTYAGTVTAGNGIGTASTQSFTIIVMGSASGTAPVPSGKPGSYPAWWFTREVIAALDANNPPSWPADYPVSDDYAVINQGQFKNMATQAYNELQMNAPSYVWATTPGGALTTMMQHWNTTDAYTTINLGQLKTVAQPFYDVLNQIGYTSGYPWTGTRADDYAAANIGQVKNVFSFNVGLDSDGNGLSDWWELKYFGHLGNSAGTSPDGNGLTLLQDYQQGNNPTNYYNQGGMIITPSVSITGGNNQASASGVFAPLALTVQVTNSSGGAVLTNAPVTFSVPSGGSSGGLSATNGGTTSSSVTVGTNTNGVAPVYYQQATGTNVTSQITAVTGGQTVSFSETATGPTPTPSPTPTPTPPGG